MRVVSLLVASVCAMTFSLAAQTAHPVVTGVVTDSAGCPIAQALVSVPGTSYAVQTDAEGRFAFDSLPGPTVRLRARFIGYRTTERDSVPVELGQTTRVDLRLARSRLAPECTMTVPAPPPE